MSTYFISDVHGRYEVFIKLLEAIKFSKNDKLIILGDIIDKGDKSIKMIKCMTELICYFVKIIKNMYVQVMVF